MKFPSSVCHLFLVLDCNFNCSYCINKFNKGYKRNYPRRDAKDWITAINKLSGVDKLVITGGQPTLHEGFVEIVNSIDYSKFKEIDIASNTSDQGVNTLMKLNPNSIQRFQLSYHSTQIGFKEHCEKISLLRSKFKSVGTHYSALVDPITDKEEFEYFGNSFLPRIGYRPDGSFNPHHLVYRCNNEKQPAAKCFTFGEDIVSPLGDIYFCHYFMYTQSKKGIKGNLLDDWLQEGITSMLCPDVGYCNPCDIFEDKHRIEKEEE
jgi:sulfatase maturation enzyme AslB (radical SAM superfamily)